MFFFYYHILHYLSTISSIRFTLDFTRHVVIIHKLGDVPDISIITHINFRAIGNVHISEKYP